MGELFGGYFNFSKCFIHENKTDRARPPTLGSHASAQQPLPPSGSVNEPRGPDALGPEAGKASWRTGPGPPKSPRECEQGSARPGGGGDSCDPTPRSHLEHVAGRGGSGGVTPASAPPTTEMWLRRPGRALIPLTASGPRCG